jgi:putative redox protein
MTHLTTSANLISRKVKFECTSRDNPAVIVDYTTPIGDGEGYTSLELFLVSLSTCVGSALALLLRKKGFEITGLTVAASGERRQQHPTCFETVLLEFAFISPDLTETAVGEALAISESTICPVWAMVKGNVKVETRFTITQD